MFCLGEKKKKEVGFVFYVNPVCQVWMGSLSKTQQRYFFVVEAGGKGKRTSFIPLGELFELLWYAKWEKIVFLAKS